MSYRCYMIQPLSLRQDRMALKLMLLHARRSRVVLYFHCKTRRSKRQFVKCVSPPPQSLLIGFDPARLVNVAPL